MKALIIGGAGFVGGHLIEYLNSLGIIEVFATKLCNESISSKSINKENTLNLDILNKEQVISTINQIKPNYIFHLAGQSSVSLSWKEPALTFNINTIGTINILEAIKVCNIQCRILLIGSAEEYGVISDKDLPINECQEIRPSNPYAISKASQEMLAKMYVKDMNLDIVIVRAFNHIGPGQSPNFVISDFAKQIAEIEKELREPIIHVGNIKLRRDFTDVRDIVRGYWMLITKGKKGEIYNIGSGRSYFISELLEGLIRLSDKKIEIKIDKSKLRTTEIVELRADTTKLEQHVNWHVSKNIFESLKDVLDYWREKNGLFSR